MEIGVRLSLAVPRLMVAMWAPAMVMAVVSCATSKHGSAQRPAPASAPAPSVEERIAAIEREAKRIDMTTENPDPARVMHVLTDLPNWQLAGDFEGSNPIYLDAIYTEGNAVRQETYYLVGAKPVLVKVDSWRDEDSDRPSEPVTHRTFYVDTERMIRSEIEGAALAARADAIVRALRGDPGSRETMEPLRNFPKAEVP